MHPLTEMHVLNLRQAFFFSQIWKISMITVKLQVNPICGICRYKQIP